MPSGGFPPLSPYGDPGDPEPSNRIDGVYAGRSFPKWGDSSGDYGQMQVLRLEGVDTVLPKRPFEIRKAVETFLGIKIKEAYPENKGTSYVIKLRNKRQIEDLKQMKKLPDGTSIRITDHPTRNQCRCVVYCPESTEYQTEELLDELKEQGVKDLRRITRKDGDRIIPTPTIILTIEGTVVPQSINFGWIRARTRPYYPTPMLCYGCFEYGHPRKRCTASPVCSLCSGNHPNTPEMPCLEKTFCKHCKNDTHPVSSKKCPIYLTEVDIQHLMVDQGIGYPAARRMYEANHRTKTAAAVVAEGNDARFAELYDKFDQLLVETGKKDNQLENMRKDAEKRDRQIDELFEVLWNKDQQLIEKDAEIAALKAALIAANIPVPPIASTSATIQSNSTDTTAETETLESDATQKQKQKCSNAEASKHNARSRSRSPRGSNQRDCSKDGRQSRALSKQGRRPELKSHHAQTSNNNTATPHLTETKKQLAKKQTKKTVATKTKNIKPSTANTQSTNIISDDERNGHSQTKTRKEGDPDMEISSDGSAYYGLLEDLP